MEDVRFLGNGFVEIFFMGGVLGDLDVFLLGREGGVFMCCCCFILEEFWMEGVVVNEVGVFRDCVVRDVVIRGGGCLGNVLFSRLYNSLILVLWFVDKFVFGNGVLFMYDNWLVEIYGFCEVLEKEGVEVVIVICVVKVFKYFFVEVEREFRGVTREVGVREAVVDMVDRGFSGEM